MTRKGGPAHSPILAEALTRQAQARADHLAYVEETVKAAERETNGYTVNARGRAAGLTTWDLFAGQGHRFRLAAYATEELRDWLEGVGGLTSLAEWERAYLGLYMPPAHAV